MLTHQPRFPLMALAGLSLLTALWTGLVRLGWGLPPLTHGLPANHGPLMIVGFLGTLIGVERAVALGRTWAYGAPLFAGLSALGLLLDLPAHLVHILAIAGSLFLVSIFIFLYSRQPSGFLATMGLGAFLWFIGNLFWHTGHSLHQIVPWWTGFLLLTIAGERWELSRLLRLSTGDRLRFLFASGIFLFGLLVSLLHFSFGIWISGGGILALAFWFLRYDIAWRTIRQAGLPRFMAVCLLGGYIWLGIAGILWIAFADLFVAGPHYDAMLHAVFLGFVFSMIFAHAPIIFPSITGVAMPFRQAFYTHLVLLHLSLLLRVGGDLALWMPGQRWGGLLNVLAVLLFLANNIRSVRLGHAESQKTVFSHP